MRIVTAAVIGEGSKVLIAKRRAGDRFGRLWEFPGGTLEAGETAEQCLKRELREELGIEVRLEDFLGAFSYFSAELNLELWVYRARIVGGRPMARDHEELRWVSPAEFKDFLFTEPDLPLVAKLSQEYENQQRRSQA